MRLILETWRYVYSAIEKGMIYTSFRLQGSDIVLAAVHLIRQISCLLHWFLWARRQTSNFRIAPPLIKHLCDEIDGASNKGHVMRRGDPGLYQSITTLYMTVFLNWSWVFHHRQMSNGSSNVDQCWLFTTLHLKFCWTCYLILMNVYIFFYSWNHWISHCAYDLTRNNDQETLHT